MRRRLDLGGRRVRTTGGRALGPTGKWPVTSAPHRGSESQTVLTAHGMGGEAKGEMAIWGLSEIQRVGRD